VLSRAKPSLWIVITLVLGYVVLFWIRVPVQPAGSTRMIVDHSLQVFVAPPCYNDAKITNNVSESSLSRAEELQYKPDSACTEEALQEVQETFMHILMEKLDIRKGIWDW